jgi:hypothetical protein
MLGTAVLENAAAWIGLPLLFAITSLGLGLLAERAVRVRLPPVLLIPVGFCVAVVGVAPLYRTGAGAWLTGPVVLVAAAAGLALGRRELRARLRPGPALVAAAAVLALWLGPSVLSGSWTWGGYNYLNDTAVQFLLADHLAERGTDAPAGPRSTRTETIGVYTATSYPLGTHGHLAALAWPLGTAVDVPYQGYLAMLAVVAALALIGLGRRLGLGPWRAAAAGGLALAANLVYQYGLQGSIKEVGAIAALACAAALGRELLSSERPVRLVILLAISFAAMLAAISAAAGPYLGVLAITLVAGAFLLPGSPLPRRLLPVAVAGTAAAVVAALPTIVGALTFLRVASGTLSPTSTVSSTLGQLQRPLEWIQVSGVWLRGEYSLPVTSPSLDRLTVMWSVVILALLAAGLVTTLRRREPGLAMIVITVTAATVVIAPRASPYADAKLLALASPFVVFGALTFVLGLPAIRGRSWLGPLAAAGVGLGVLWSAAYAFHDVKLAPVDRLQALEQAVDRLPGDDLILLNEAEEFGKFYGRHRLVNSAFEAITPVPAVATYRDLDDDPAYTQRFASVVVRRGPGVSRPPGNFRRVFANRYYEAWRKAPSPTVLAHAGLRQPEARPGCADVRALARQGRGGGLLVAPTPEVARLDVASAPDRPAGWPVRPDAPDEVEPRTPGEVSVVRTVPAGRYTVWVRGSTGRKLSLRVDGRTVGRVEGINTLGQWLEGGTVELRAGRHEIELERPGGTPAPGDGAPSVIGPVVLARDAGAARRPRPVGGAPRVPGELGLDRGRRPVRTDAPVTVAIPVLDGGPRLGDVLRAVAAQRVDRPVEILVADSGSRDGSAALARRLGADVFEVASFSHGGTRNLLVQRAAGDHVAFLTQDAVPAHDGWLAELLAASERPTTWPWSSAPTSRAPGRRRWCAGSSRTGSRG